jgi:hypothetical protein
MCIEGELSSYRSVMPNLSAATRLLSNAKIESIAAVRFESLIDAPSDRHRQCPFACLIFKVRGRLGARTSGTDNSRRSRASRRLARQGSGLALRALARRDVDRLIGICFQGKPEDKAQADRR